MVQGRRAWDGLCSHEEPHGGGGKEGFEEAKQLGEIWSKTDSDGRTWWFQHKREVGHKIGSSKHEGTEA
eukprot:4875811-Alexandrium_andersonii.AAC.1